MTKVREFIANLARAGKSFKDIREMAETAFPGQCLSKSQIYLIIKNVKDGVEAGDNRGVATTRWKTDADFIEAVRLDVESDRRVTIRTLAQRHDVAISTIYKVLTNDLGLSKKSARWVPRLLSEEQKSARVAASKAFLKRYHDEGERFLNRTVTMDESMVALHTPETKRQSKQWIERGKPGPVKARSHASRQ